MATGVGIDVGSRTSRVVKLARRGGVVSWAGSLAAETDADLRPELRSAGIAPAGGVVGLAGTSMILRYSRLPLVPAWKLKMLVGYETTQGGEADVSFDYRLLSLPTHYGSNELTVLTAAAKNETLAEMLGSLTERGIKGVDFAPDAVALHEVFSKCPESQEALDEFCLLLDVGASTTEMAIAYNGGLVFARSLGFGGNDFTGRVAETLGVRKDQAERLKEKRGEVLDEAEVASRPSADQPMLTALSQAADELFGMVRASLMFARAQTKLVDMEIGRVYVSGAGARLRGLGEFIGARLEVRSALLRPPDAWGAPAEPGGPCEWMIAIGLALLALEPREERMSILPPAEQAKRRFWQRDIFAYAACAVFVLLAAVTTTTHIHNRSLAKDAIEQRRTLAADAAKRDRDLDELVEGNTLRRDRLGLLANTARSGERLARFLDLVKRGQQGAVILSDLSYEAGDLNRPNARPVATLDGTVGASVKTHHDVLDEFGRQLVVDPKQIVREKAAQSADGSSLEFRLRIPLDATAVGGADE